MDIRMIDAIPLARAKVKKNQKAPKTSEFRTWVRPELSCGLQTRAVA
jgi:hypothetical protein